jgi:hypothetical protein
LYCSRSRTDRFRGRTQKGLYFFDTRLISSWRIYASREKWDLLNGGDITHYASRVFLINRTIPTEDGDIPARTVSLVVSRSIGEDPAQDLDLVNNGRQPTRFNLEIAIRGDFADVFEVKSGHIVRRGRITSVGLPTTCGFGSPTRIKNSTKEVAVMAVGRVCRRDDTGLCGGRALEIPKPSGPENGCRLP